MKVRQHCLKGETRLIRQAISCDICGTEMQHPTHWFVAYDQGAELRLSGWNSRSRLRAGAKHLCGQTCLHRLVDDFMARTLSARAPSAADKNATEEKPHERATPLNGARAMSTPLHAALPRPVALALDEFESSARLIAPLQVAASAGPSRPLPLRLAVAAPKSADNECEAVGEATPSYSPRTWRAEAWKREREREQQSKRRPLSGSARRQSIG
jgi:hypothetical protein